MYQKEKPQSVLIGTWKFYQKGALLGDFTAVTGVTVTYRHTDRLAELSYKISLTK
jgi:spermidine/putrescine-binding protein